jgi:hypothetical protein
MLAKVDSRVSAYEGALDDWLENWFRPILDRIELGTLSWEEIITAIAERDSSSGQSIGRFYELCLEHNRRATRTRSRRR